MIYSLEEIESFISKNYPDITDTFIDQNHITSYCPHCNTIMGLQVLVKGISTSPSTYGSAYDWKLPFTVVLKCPSCKLHRIWVLYQIKDEENEKDHVFRLLSIPGEGKYEIPELPDEPPTLRRAYNEAIRCMDANCPMAAAAM